MTDKASILKLLTPQAALEPLTPEASACLPKGTLEHGFVRIAKFPFSIGRESRVKEREGRLIRLERLKFTQHEPNNDLYLIDSGRPLNISREHFVITQSDHGFRLLDRRSACGTSVDSEHIGGHDSGGEIELKDGSVIAIGSEDTPYLFRFIAL